MEKEKRVEELNKALETIKAQEYFQGKDATVRDIERKLKHLRKEEEIKSDYKAAYEKELRKCGGWMAISILGILFTLAFLISAFNGLDNYDIDDQIGPYVCAQHGLSFDSVDISTNQAPKTIANMKIRCIDKTKEKSLADGYVVEIGRNEQPLVQFNRRN